MEMGTKFIKVCFIIFINLCNNIYAQTSATSGSWTTGSTWIGGSSPTLSGGAGNLNSDVTIETGHTVTLSSDLTIKSGVTLRVKGTLIINTSGNVDFNNGSTIIVESGGTLEMDMLTNSNNSTNVTIHGNLIVNGNYTAGTGASLSGNGDMTVSGTSSGSGTTFGTTLSCSDCAIDGTGTIENAIIDGSNYGQHAPIEPYWNWTYSQQIYYQSEIAQEGNITRLAFEYNGNASYTDQVEIYLGHTTKTSFSSRSNWISYSDLTLVYDGSYSVSSTKGWYWIDFDTDFYYNNSDNLVIAVYEKTTGYHSASDEFYVADGGLDRVLTFYDDYTNPDPSSPPTADYKQEWIPSLKLEIGSAGTPLPIELISFIGTSIDNDLEPAVLLEWAVASQINNDYFTIDHSSDGYKWETVTIISGAGNSSQTMSYQYRHGSPIGGINYYRLSQTDYDGKFERFNPIAVYIKKNKQYIVRVYNILGQPVHNKEYKGLVFIQWDNGDIEKTIQK
jgi:hypothetical protein